ncbi:MAG: SMP-30/gluconolactonase/LRE family protein [Ignavibacteriaceae bacterium]|jgi:DNA-binding beta-propeller fold protein YncE|nr:SMP-30/gluconolactonase/LRE family protein [Ignavibacteriaceae bacterium]
MKKLILYLIVSLVFLTTYTDGQDFSLQVITGTGKAGFKDGKSAELNKPIRLASYKNNSIIFADINNHAVRIVTLDGEVTTIAGGPDKKGYKDGLSSEAEFNSPHGVAYDSVKDIIYVAEAGNNLIRTITKNNEGEFVVSTLAGIPNEKGFKDGKSDSVLFNSPHAVILRKEGGVYVVDIGNSRVRQIVDGIVSTVAGSGKSGNDDGKYDEASFVYAIDIVSDGENIFVADAGSNLIRKVIPNKDVKTIQLSDTLKTPHGIAVDDNGSIYIADMGTHRILKIDTHGKVTTIAGTGKAGSDLNELNRPSAVLVHAGYLWIADLDNHQIKVLKLDN